MGLNNTENFIEPEKINSSVDEEIDRTRKALKEFISNDQGDFQKFKESTNLELLKNEDEKIKNLQSLIADPNPDPPPTPPDPYDPSQVKNTGTAWIYGGSRFELTFLNTTQKIHKLGLVRDIIRLAHFRKCASRTLGVLLMDYSASTSFG
jgi:hypothetical protein